MPIGAIFTAAAGAVDVFGWIKQLAGLFHSVIGKILVIAVLSIIWTLFFEPMLLPVLRMVQWMMSLFFYPMVSQQFLQFAYDAVVGFSTIKILLWIAAGHTEHSLPKVGDQQLYGNQQIPGVHAPRAEGFTSRRIPL